MNQNVVVPAPIGTDYDYIMAQRHGRVLLVAGQIAKTSHNVLHATGRCGEDVDMPTAQINAEIAAGQVLAWIAQHLSPDESVRAVLRMSVYVAVGNDPFDISIVADAASGKLIEILGDAGKHPRSVIGVSRLPRNAPVLLEATVAIRNITPNI
jgi:enamine deaminase RidA (YjgF/YER057c/UK114 family)